MGGERSGPAATVAACPLDGLAVPEAAAVVDLGRGEPSAVPGVAEHDTSATSSSDAMLAATG